MNRSKWIIALCAVSLVFAGSANAHLGADFDLPKLPDGVVPTIDGDPSEWMDFAFTDGTWTWPRVQDQPYFTEVSHMNPPTEFEPEGTGGTSDDFSFDWFTAWDDNYLYVSAVVTDNVWDIHSVGAESQSFANSDVLSIFLDTDHEGIADAGKQTYWWRADPGNQGLCCRYINHTETGEGQLDFGLEATGTMSETVVDPVSGSNWTLEAAVSFSMMNEWDPSWVAPFEGRVFGYGLLMIEADGANRNAQWMLYGQGDDPSTLGDTTMIGAPDVAVEASSWAAIKHLFK